MRRTCPDCLCWCFCPLPSYQSLVRLTSKTSIRTFTRRRPSSRFPSSPAIHHHSQSYLPSQLAFEEHFPVITSPAENMGNCASRLRLSSSPQKAATSAQGFSETQSRETPPAYKAMTNPLSLAPASVQSQSQPGHQQSLQLTMPPPSARPSPMLTFNNVVQCPSSQCICKFRISARQGHLRNDEPFVVTEDLTAEFYRRPVVIPSLSFFHDVGLACTQGDMEYSYCALNCYIHVKKAVKNEKDKSKLARLQGYCKKIVDFTTKFFKNLDGDLLYEGKSQYWWIYHTINCLEAKDVEISWGRQKYKCMLRTAEVQGEYLRL